MEGLPRKPTQAVSQLFILTGSCILGMGVFGFLAMALINLVLGFPLQSGTDLDTFQNLGSRGRIALLFLQGVTALGGFVAGPYLATRFQSLRSAARSVLDREEEAISQDTHAGLGSSKNEPVRPGATMLILVFFLALLMMPVNGWLAAWNHSLHPPSFLAKAFEWAVGKEKEMEILTLFLIDFSTPLEVALGFLVVAGTAAVSEEFFFRKLVQPRFIALTGNLHAGIWVTAAIFSAIHLQFLGFLPRMALGALFGYYFVWTNNIWIPILGHALNNGITLLGFYLYQNQVSPINVDDPKQIPWYLGAVAAGVTWSLASMVKEEADKIRSRKPHTAS